MGIWEESIYNLMGGTVMAKEVGLFVFFFCEGVGGWGKKCWSSGEYPLSVSSNPGGMSKRLIWQ